MTNKEKLQKILDRYSLTDGQKQLWNQAFKYLPVAYVADFFDFLENMNAEELLFYSQIMEDKVRALESKDHNLWDSILLKEKEFLSHV